MTPVRFYILTLRWAADGGVGMATYTGHTNHRDDAYAYTEAINRAHRGGAPANANTTFFYLGDPQ